MSLNINLQDSPSGRFVLVQTYKNQASLSLRDVKGADLIEYRFVDMAEGVDEAPWSSIEPSQTILYEAVSEHRYKVEVRFYNSVKNVYFYPSIQYMEFPPLASAQTEVLERKRNYIKLKLNFINGPYSYFDYRVGVVGEEVKSVWRTINNQALEQELLVDSYPASNSANDTLLYSNTQYEVDIRVYDPAGRTFGKTTNVIFRTAAFEKPVAKVKKRGLTHLEVEYAAVDSTIMISNNSNSQTNIKINGGEVYTVIYQGSELTPLSANTEYEVSALFQDEFGKEAPVSSKVLGRTLETPRAAYRFTSGLLTSVTQPDQMPEITGVMTSGDYIKEIEYNFGEGILAVATERVAAGITETSHKVSHDNSVALIQGARKQRASVIVKTTFIEIVNLKERKSPTILEQTLSISLSQGLLEDIMPVSIEDSYTTPLELTPHMALDSLINYRVNQMKIKPIKRAEFYGLTMDKIRYAFNSDYVIFDYQKDTVKYFLEGEHYPDYDRSISGLDANYLITLGPYNTINNDKLTITVEDRRELTFSKTYTIQYQEYRPPRITIGAVDRVDNFSRYLSVRNINITYSRLRGKDGVAKNKMARIGLFYYKGSSYEKIEYRQNAGSLSEITNLVNPEAIGGGAAQYDEVIVSPEPATGLFAESETYRVAFFVSDLISHRTGIAFETNRYLIPSGESLFFMDKENMEIGINTTDPKGTFDVGGQLYADEIFSLNSLHFKEEDIIDIPEIKND